MAIILEGPDAAGKSTLGRQLASLGMKHLASGGAPKNLQEVLAYCQMQLDACKNPIFVLDRITPISHPIYNPVYKGHVEMGMYLSRMINRPDVILVYCRPPIEALMRPEKHQWKDYDTENHKQNILTRQHVYIREYDRFFSLHPHLSYDYTEREHDYTVELVAMLAATQHSPQAIVELKHLEKARVYA